MAIHPMHDKDGLHTTKPGEAYVEQLSVAAAARGKGIGKLLLGWAEARAREHNCRILTLSVLNGNPAMRLYERRPACQSTRNHERRLGPTHQHANALCVH